MSLLLRAASRLVLQAGLQQQAARGVATSAARLDDGLAQAAGPKEFTDAWMKKAPSNMDVPQLPSNFLGKAEALKTQGDLFPVNLCTPHGITAEAKMVGGVMRAPALGVLARELVCAGQTRTRARTRALANSGARACTCVRLHAVCGHLHPVQACVRAPPHHHQAARERGHARMHPTATLGEQHCSHAPPARQASAAAAVVAAAATSSSTPMTSGVACVCACVHACMHATVHAQDEVDCTGSPA